MKPPEEYLSMGQSQGDKVMAHDLSAALKSMCETFKTFNESYQFNGNHAGKLKQELLRSPDETVGRNEDTLGPLEERTIGTVPSKEIKYLTGIESEDTAGLDFDTQATVLMTCLPLRANNTYRDNSFLPRRSGKSNYSTHKSRKTSEPSSEQIRLDHHGDVAKGSPDVAHIPHPKANLHRTEEPQKTHVGKTSKKSNELERLQNDIPGQPRSFMTHTTGIKTLAILNKSNNAIDSELKSDGDGDSERDVDKETLAVNIPADTEMATDVRAYSQWPGMYKTLSTVKHVLITLFR